MSFQCLPLSWLELLCNRFGSGIGVRHSPVAEQDPVVSTLKVLLGSEWSMEKVTDNAKCCRNLTRTHTGPVCESLVIEKKNGIYSIMQLSRKTQTRVWVNTSKGKMNNKSNRDMICEY